VGYIATRSASEAAYDLATGQDQDVYATRLWEALTAPAGSGSSGLGAPRGMATCPTGACHMQVGSSSPVVLPGDVYERRLSDEEMRAIFQWLEPVEHAP
jgi:hypothetical protein